MGENRMSYYSIGNSFWFFWNTKFNQRHIKRVKRFFTLSHLSNKVISYVWRVLSRHLHNLQHGYNTLHCHIYKSQNSPTSYIQSCSVKFIHIFTKTGYFIKYINHIKSYSYE